MSLMAVVGSLWEIYEGFLIFENHMTVIYSKQPFLFFILYILYTLQEKTAKVPRKNMITNDVATVTYTNIEFPVTPVK